MIRISILLLVTLPLLSTPIQAQTPPIAGGWIGEVDFPNELTVFRLTVPREGLGQATADLLPSGPNGLPIQRLASEPSGIRFELPLEPSPLVFAGRAGADEVSGTVRRGEVEGTFRMLRLAEIDASRRAAIFGNYETAAGGVIWIGPFGEFGADQYVLEFASGRFAALYPRSATVFVAGPAIVTPLFPLAVTVTFQTDRKGKATGLFYQEGDRPPVPAVRRDLVREEVAFRSGDLNLAGTLTLPAKKGSHPAIVLLHGSGPEDRNFLGPWVDFFARQGLAVLAYDKRGVGASEGDWKQSGIEDLAGDAEAAFRYLGGRADIDPGRIGLFGISQGGWVAPLVASRNPKVAFILLHSGASVTVAKQGEEFLEQELSAYGFPEPDIAEALAYQRLDDDFTRSGQGWEKLQEAYRKASEVKAPWLVGELKPADDPFRVMYRKMMDFDPAPCWRQVKCPVLAFFGELDHNVPPHPNAEILEKLLAEAGNSNHKIVVLPKANHLLLQAETGVMTEYPRLRGFVPEYFDQLASWIRKVVTAPAQNRSRAQR